jgi:quinol monooxygenase YgiN
MIVNYTTFRIRHHDDVAFDDWFLGLCSAARDEDGCIVYDYFNVIGDPGRRAVLAAWRDEHAFGAHRVHPLHVEMLALGGSKWGICDLDSNSWPDARGHRTSARDKVDATVPGQGREAMLERAAQYLAEDADSAAAEHPPASG